MRDIRTLGRDYAVIDLDTGTILGTNLVIVRASEVTEDALSNDSDAYDLGIDRGQPLYSSDDND